MGKRFEGYSRIPADYPIDALSLEAERRAKKLGRPYSYGQLIADTTREQREEMAESYRVKLAAAIRRGRTRVSGGDTVRIAGNGPGKHGGYPQEAEKEEGQQQGSRGINPGLSGRKGAAECSGTKEASRWTMTPRVIFTL